jgi:predicted DCC family thiol-disulfide oxidoreductase YuxK
MSKPVGMAVEAASSKHDSAVREWTLIYDGECEFCRRQVDFIVRCDRTGCLTAVPFQGVVLERYGVGREAAEQAMQLVAPSGAVWSGAAAARELVSLLPRLRPFGWLFRVPGAMFLAERAYRWIARHRHRFGCASRVCRRGDTERQAEPRRG